MKLALICRPLMICKPLIRGPLITLDNNKFVVCVFLADLGRIKCTESKSHIGFA